MGKRLKAIRAEVAALRDELAALWHRLGGKPKPAAKAKKKKTKAKAAKPKKTATKKPQPKKPAPKKPHAKKKRAASHTSTATAPEPVAAPISDETIV